jgi:M6 family metalloprotease-like protein
MNKRRGLAIGVCTSLLFIALSSSSIAATQITSAKCAKAGTFRTSKNVRYQCKKTSKGLRWVLASAKSRSSTASQITSTKCAKAGTFRTSKNVRYQCKKTSKGLRWVLASAKSRSSTTTTTIVPSRQTKPSKGIKIYTGGAGSLEQFKQQSFELPRSVAAAPSGTNVKFWIYNPDSTNTAIGSRGIFYTTASASWTFVSSNSDGSFYANWPPGDYTIDVVEPSASYLRKRYFGSVNSSGVLTMDDLKPNSQGYFTVTVDKLATTPTFSQRTSCQLLDQTNNKTLQVGFPKATGRLPSNGVIRALIIPVDFEDVPGKGNPEIVFAEMTDGMNDYYFHVSANQVKFEFTTLRSWVRMPVSSSYHGLGTWSKGDANGYLKLALKTADPLVDFSLFDVVYVLSPKEIPSSSIAYGPAGPMLPNNGLTTNDGPVMNISLSGADAWQVGSGSPWKWISHETGHLFGLHDLYTTDTATYGQWDLMSDNWSQGVIELNSWNRYLLDWLSDSQVVCLDASNISAAGSEVIRSRNQLWLKFQTQKSLS